MENKQLKAEESLSIIQEMIETEKIRFHENGFIYLFWGWMVVAAALLQYLLLYLEVEKHYYAWFIMILGGIFTGFYHWKKDTKMNMPLSGRILGYIWSITGVNIFAIAFLLPRMAGDWLLFIILAFVGLATVVSGALFRFRIMILGGILCNALAFASLFTPYFYWGLLSIAAVVFADLIPGYVLRAKYQNQNV